MDVIHQRSVGSFELIERIGRGASGEVWRACERGTHRVVAVKVLAVETGGANSKRATQLAWRFQREIEAAAQQDHPHIARIFASGESDGRPWYAMELIEGLPIDAHADAAALDLPARLALFREVCAGVQHAHERGVIHRDLKPANLLVRVDGVPKILDFGLARFLQDAGLGTTLSLDGQALGTPMFMAPEQAAGRLCDVGVGADVYALGIILYRLADGGWPFDESLPPLQLLAVARDSEPRQPLGLDRDLTAIIGKALARTAAERYASVHAFSEDLARYLAGEPVSARTRTLGYVLRRRLSRHPRVTAAVGGALAIILAVGLAYVQERRRAAGRNARALQQAQALINTIVFDLHERLEPLGLTDALADATERVARFPWEFDTDASGQLDLRRFQALAADVRGAGLAAKNHKIEALAEFRKAAGLLEALAREHPAHLGLLAERADAELAVAQMLNLLGNHEEALALSRRLLRSLESPANADGAGVLVPARLQAHQTIGAILRGLGRAKEAEAEARTALSLPVPGEADGRAELDVAGRKVDLGDACLVGRHHHEARIAFDSAEAACRRALARNSQDQPARDLLSRSLLGRAAVSIATADLATARTALSEACALRDQLHREGRIPPLVPADLVLADRYHELGLAFIERQEDDPALAALWVARRLFEGMFAQGKDRLAARRKLCAVALDAARAHDRQQHEQPAAEAFLRALRHAKEIKKHAAEADWHLVIAECHLELLRLPRVEGTGTDEQRSESISKSLISASARTDLTDAQRRRLEILQTRFAATPRR